MPIVETELDQDNFVELGVVKYLHLSVQYPKSFSLQIVLESFTISLLAMKHNGNLMWHLKDEYKPACLS